MKLPSKVVLGFKSVSVLLILSEGPPLGRLLRRESPPARVCKDTGKVAACCASCLNGQQAKIEDSVDAVAKPRDDLYPD